MRETFLIIHFIGLAMGLGTSFGFMFLGFAASKLEKEEAIKFTLNASYLAKMGHIGLLLLVISGLYLMTPYWSAIEDETTLQLKLLMVLVLGAFIGMISANMRRAKSGTPEVYLKKVRTIGMLSLLTSITIVILAVLTFH